MCKNSILKVKTKSSLRHSCVYCYFEYFDHISVQVFHDIAYKAKDRQDLLAGIDEFLDEVIVLPPGEWDPAIRIEPPKNLPPPDKRSNPNRNASNKKVDISMTRSQLISAFSFNISPSGKTCMLVLTLR